MHFVDKICILSIFFFSDLKNIFSFDTENKFYNK